MRFRLLRPFAAAVAAAVLAVAAPPAAHAGRGDIGQATQLASAVGFHAQAAGQFGYAVGRPDYAAFGNTAFAIAAEAQQVEAMLAVGDVAGAQASTARMRGLVDVLDKQEDRLSKCGYLGRDARKAGDDYADHVEDTFKDLRREVEDLHPIPFAPVVVHHPPVHHAPVHHAPVHVGPPVVVNQTDVRVNQTDVRVNVNAPQVNFPPGAVAPSGFQYQGEGDQGGVYYGPSRGAAPGGLYGPGPQAGPQFNDPQFDDPNSFRPVPNRDSFRPVPRQAPLPPAYGPPRDRFDGPGLPAPGLSAPPQARIERSELFERFERTERIEPAPYVFTVSRMR